MSSVSPTLSDQAAPSVPHKRKTSKVRWVVLIVLSLGIAFNYVDRSALSVALPAISEEFHLSDAAQGWILSAFSWSYVLFMIPAGWLIDKYGSKVVFGVGSLIWGAATAAVSLVSGFTSLFGLRLIMGASEAPSYPAAAQVVKDWFPKSERSFASGTYNNGSKVGATLATPLVSLIIAWVGWKGSFVVAGAMAFLFGVFWLWYYKRPEQNKNVSQAELELIHSDQETDSVESSDGISTIQLLKTRTVAAMSAGFFTVNFVSFFFFTWFPTYLIKTFHMSIIKFGFVGMLPGIAAIIGGFLAGAWSDHLYRTGHSVTYSRKLILVVGMLGSAIIGLAAFSHNVVWVVFLLCAANMAHTGSAAALWSLPADVAPTRSAIGRIGSIQNAFSNLSGILAPILIGYIVGLTGSFVIPLLLVSAVAIAGALIYAFALPKIEPIKITTTK